MSMMPPPFSADPSDEGIPAADPGQGAPEKAPGFGIEGEDPDLTTDNRADDEGRPALGEPPFRTPDPKDIGPEH